MHWCSTAPPLSLEPLPVLERRAWLSAEMSHAGCAGATVPLAAAAVPAPGTGKGSGSGSGTAAATCSLQSPSLNSRRAGGRSSSACSAPQETSCNSHTAHGCKLAHQCSASAAGHRPHGLRDGGTFLSPGASKTCSVYIAGALQQRQKHARWVSLALRDATSLCPHHTPPSP
jgi:hypothetical protein